MTPTELTTAAEPAGKDRVKLRVEVAESAMGAALERTYRRWANEIKVPGFRKGKIPRQLIDARVGADLVRDEALRDALPGWYREALRAEDLEAIAAPEIDLVDFAPGAPIVFEATVDVRPEVAVPDLAAITVPAPDPEVTDMEVDEQLERLRDRFAELETVSREARRGDHVLIDITGSRGGEPVEGASSPDLLYEVGSRTGPPQLDEELEGNRPGAILRFTDTLPGGPVEPREEVSFTVLLKEVKAKRLPVLDDEFAKTVGEFDSLDALREDLKVRLSSVKQDMVERELRERVLAALVAASDLDPPEKLVDGEFSHRLEHLERDLERAGLTMADYASRIGSTELEVRSDLRSGAARSVKAELLLEEIARSEGMEASEEDLGLEIAGAAVRAGRDPRELARELAGKGHLPALAADIIRRKALDFVVASVNVTGLGETSRKEQAPPPTGADPR